MSQWQPEDGPGRRQPPRAYPRQDHYSPSVQENVQQHVPPQWQGKIFASRERNAGYGTYPGEARPGRRRTPFPSHLMHFPAELVTFKGGRGPSFWRMVYLGTHPLALLFSVFLALFVVEGILIWVMLVAMMWLAWCAVITLAWLCRAGFARVTGH